MAQVIVRFEGDGLRRMTIGANRLASEDLRHAYRRAINHTGGKAFTQVKRALSRQTGLTQRDVVRYGNLRARRANFGSLEFAILASGGRLPLKAFDPKQFSWGTQARIFGKVERFPGWFIYGGHYRSGKLIAGGHVFENTRGFNSRSGRNNAIEQQFADEGLAAQMVQGQSAAAFRRVANTLPDRVLHEVDRIAGDMF